MNTNYGLDERFVSFISSRLDLFNSIDSNVYNFRCPFCGDSKKDKSKKRGYIHPNRKGNALSFTCHNCNTSKPFRVMIKELFPDVYKEYLIQSAKESGLKPEFVEKRPKARKNVEDILYNGALFDLPNINDLPSDHPCRLYVESRMIPKDKYKDLFYCDNFYEEIVCKYLSKDKLENKKYPKDQRLILPFINTNRVEYIQGRALGSSGIRYITLKGNSDNLKLYGIDNINKDEMVKIIEGPIDSLFLKNCIATADSSLSKVYDYFESAVLIYDCQPRNPEIVKIIERSINNKQRVCLLPVDISGKDINDMILNGMSPDEVEDIIKENTFIGLRAKLKFSKWRQI